MILTLHLFKSDLIHQKKPFSFANIHSRMYKLATLATVVTFEGEVVKNRFADNQVDFAIHENNMRTEIQIPQL